MKISRTGSRFWHGGGPLPEWLWKHLGRILGGYGVWVSEDTLEASRFYFLLYCLQHSYVIDPKTQLTGHISMVTAVSLMITTLIMLSRSCACLIKRTWNYSNPYEMCMASHRCALMRACLLCSFSLHQVSNACFLDTLSKLDDLS